LANERPHNTDAATVDRDESATESLEARNLRKFGNGLVAFGQDIQLLADTIDRLANDTRWRVLREVAARCRTFRDLADAAANAIEGTVKK
jgi:hypothetical protein